MRKKLLLFILFLPCLFLFGWLCFLSFQKTQGKEVTVVIMGYDPRDLLSGHYIAYRIDWNKTDCGQFEGGVCPKNDFCRNWKGRGGACRFYVPEQDAAVLDGLFRRGNGEEMVFEVVYSYIQGREAIAERLLINGAPWQEVVPATK